MENNHDNYNIFVAECTRKVTVAYVSNHVVQANDLVHLVSSVRAALKRAVSFDAVDDAIAQKPKPSVPVCESIEQDHLICLEDGLKFKTLKRHLMAIYNMTPEEYRQKWDLPPDYPMVAPAYAAVRSRLAREVGLWRFNRANDKD